MAQIFKDNPHEPDVKKEVTIGGTGLFVIIFLIFLILKLCNMSEVANWSWWAVTSPLWIPFAFVMAFIIILGIFGGIFLVIITLLETMMDLKLKKNLNL